MMKIILFALALILCSCTSNKHQANTNIKEARIQKNSISEKDISDFSDAVVYGELSKVKTMISNNSDIINAKDAFGFVALHNVMCEEQRSTISYLIDYGADVNAQNEYGIAPLHLVCFVENAELLIEAGANIHITDKKGNTPLHTLATDGEERIDVIQYLIELGTNKDLKNHSGQTPLDIAKRRNDRKIIALLE